MTLNDFERTLHIYCTLLSDVGFLCVSCICKIL